MDPVTAGLNLANAIVMLITKIWDATPADQKGIAAGDISKTLHNCSAFLQTVQANVNTAVAGVPK